MHFADYRLILAYRYATVARAVFCTPESRQ